MAKNNPIRIFGNVRKSNIPAFFFGCVAGISFMLIGGLLYLRGHLMVRYDFPGITMSEMDDAFESAIPRTTGWTATRDVCSLPMASSGRIVHNWKFCNQTYARMLLDSEKGMTVSSFLPCTISITHDEDGHAVLARVNTELIGFLLGGEARSVFVNQISPEQDALIYALANHARTENTEKD